MRKLNSILACILLAVCFNAGAQKLPKIQQGGLRAPSAIKIDGKATEWDDKFQAYNNATNVFYTLSNDDNNLYLTVQADEQSVISKILRGGITFTVNTSGKKEDKAGAGVTYPVFGSDRPRINFKNMPEIVPGSEISVKRADSFMYASNKLLAEKSKNIITRGIKGVDTLISVYNEDGIRVSEAFNNKMVYTYELAIDLKHLGLSIDNATKFAYNFKLNGINLDEIMKNMTVVHNGDGSMTISNGTAPAAAAPIVINSGSVSFSGPANGAAISITGMGSPGGLQSLTSPTDFWGEYTLVKK